MSKFRTTETIAVIDSRNIRVTNSEITKNLQTYEIKRDATIPENIFNINNNYKTYSLTYIFSDYILFI